MKLKRGCDQPDQRPPRVYIESAEIIFLLKVSLQPMAPDSQPVVDGLPGKFDIFFRLQLDYYEASLARNSQKVDYSASA